MMPVYITYVMLQYHLLPDFYSLNKYLNSRQCWWLISSPLSWYPLFHKETNGRPTGSKISEKWSQWTKFQAMTIWKQYPYVCFLFLGRLLLHWSVSKWLQKEIWFRYNDRSGWRQVLKASVKITRITYDTTAAIQLIHTASLTLGKYWFHISSLFFSSYASSFMSSFILWAPPFFS